MGTVQDRRTGPSPFIGIPVNRAKFVVAMPKSDGAERPVRSHRVKGKNDLPATLRPAAMHGDAFLADVLGGEHRRAIRRQVESEDPFCRIGRRCVALVDP